MGIQKSNRLNIDDMQTPERALSPDEARKVRGGADITAIKDPLTLTKDPLPTKLPITTKPTTTVPTDPLIKTPIKP